MNGITSATQSAQPMSGRRKAGDSSHRAEKENMSIYSFAQNAGKDAESIEDCLIISHSSNEVQASRFSNINEFTNYLMDNYKDFKNGTITISRSYLRECLNDEENRQQLENTLSDAEKMIKDSEENIDGFIGMKVEINADGEIETETYGGKVMFNEGKRAAQVAAARTNSDVNMIMSMLSKDLSDCESGLEKGFCDENEVAKVRAMIQKAQAKQLQIAAQERCNKEKGKETPDTLTINLLI